jgi:transcriptional regulator with XRE-family HTH domain
MDSKLKTPVLTVIQCRMARVGLGLGVRELAEIAMVAPNTVFRFENGEALKPRTIKALQDALTDAGAEFMLTKKGEGVVIRTK